MGSADSLRNIVITTHDGLIQVTALADSSKELPTAKTK